MKAIKHPIYIICHLCFFNQVRMAYFCAMEDFMDPRKIPWYCCWMPVIRLSVLSYCEWYDYRRNVKIIHHAPGLKYTINSMTLNEICFFRQFSLATMKKGVCFMLICSYNVKGATFTNNNSTPFHLSHIFKLTQQTTKLVTEANSQVWIEYERIF